MKKIETMLLFLAIGVFTICGAHLAAVCLSYRAAEKEYREAMAAAAPGKVPEPVTEKIPEVTPAAGSGAEKPDGEFISSIDFGKLSEINPDIVGWQSRHDAWLRAEEPSEHERGPWDVRAWGYPGLQIHLPKGGKKR